MNVNIHFSAAARQYLKTMITKACGLGFRLSIKKTGCSGYSYAPSIVETINPNDYTFEVDGLQIYVDTKWADLLQEIQVDYIEENKAGLKQKRLVFINPKESSRCGCGESFHLE